MISLYTPDGGSPPPAAPAWLELTEALSRCQRLLRDELAQHSVRHGVTEAQVSLLWACSRGPDGGLSQSELSQALSVSAAHVSGQVEQLRSKGLLAGHRRAPDRRRQVWQLTDQGQAGLGQLLDDLLRWAQQLDERLTPDRRQMLSELLTQLAAFLSGPGQAGVPQSVQHPDAADTAERRGGAS